MSSILYSYWGLNNPNYAIQINDGNYIISDDNGVIELDYTLTTIIKNYVVSGIVFFDYSEENEILLITNEDSGVISEVTWGVGDYGTVLWSSSYLLSGPQCATYMKGDSSQIIIADTENDRVVKYSKSSNTYTPIDSYKTSDGSYEISKFNKPQRVFQYADGNICVSEREGLVFGYNDVKSSSSSSSSP